MVGYINNTLSIARLGDKNIHNDFSTEQMITPNGLNVTSCRFVLFPLYITLQFYLLVLSYYGLERK